MLKQLLFPEKIGSHFLFTEKIVGIEIQHNTLLACKALYHSNKETITEWFNQTIDNESLNAEDDLVEALKDIKKKSGKNCSYALSIPAHLIIFKELTLPFKNKEQIEQILPFELEPLLPFSMSEAYFDFIITHYDNERHESKILIAIIQKETLEHQLSLCVKADIEIDVAIIDFLALIEIQKLSTQYSAGTTQAALIFYSSHTTIGYTQNGTIKFIRSIKNGLQQALKSDAIFQKIAYSNIVQQAAIEDISLDRYPALHGLIQELKASLYSFNIGNEAYPYISNIVCNFNTPLHIHNIEQVLSSEFNCPAQIIDSALLNSIPTLNQNVQSLDYKALAVASIALYKIHTQPCNLLRSKDLVKESNIRAYQIVTAVILSLLFLILSGGYYWYNVSAAKQRLNQINSQLSNKLVKVFDIEKGRNKPVKKLLAEAEEINTEERKVWGALSGKEKISFLSIFSELTAVLNKNETNVTIKKMTIDNNVIQINGSVPGYPELRLLEQNLQQSTTFILKNIPQEPVFQISLQMKGTHE
jgi:type II secretory pathway component PulL